MSAFLCTDKHLSAIVNYALVNGLAENAYECGTMLRLENEASLYARYRDTDKSPFVHENVFLTPVEVLHLCRCYDYQSCEHDGYRTSKAYAFITKVLKHIAPTDADMKRICESDEYTNSNYTI